MNRCTLLFALLLVSGIAHAGFDQSHASWNSLLHDYVVVAPDGLSSRVRYAGLLANRAKLNSYLDEVSNVTAAEYNSWPRRERLAFLINAYNAYTIALVLSKYPSLHSIRDLGSIFESPWKIKFDHLFGSLHDLEFIDHSMIRAPGHFDEPRVHFALVCASVGCPMLRKDAYTAIHLEEQLEDGLRRFLSDRTRNRFDPTKQELQVSSIFRWYHDDFAKGHQASGSVTSLLRQHADDLADVARERDVIRNQQFEIEYLPYDWSLNDAK